MFEIQSQSYSFFFFSVNSLQLILRPNSERSFTSFQSTNSSLGGSYLQNEVAYVTTNTKGTFSFLNFASFKRFPLGNSALELIEVVELANQSNSTFTTYAITFPRAFTSVTYDPDFSVTLTPSNGGTFPELFVLCCYVVFCVCLVLFRVVCVVLCCAV